MDWKFRSDQPIYTQLTARLAEAIVAGAYAPGERLPSVRDLAIEAGVNPNTVQRALADLERERRLVERTGLGTKHATHEMRLRSQKSIADSAVRLNDASKSRFKRNIL